MEDVPCARADGTDDRGERGGVAWIGGSETAEGYEVEELAADVHCGSEVCVKAEAECVKFIYFCER